MTFQKNEKLFVFSHSASRLSRLTACLQTIPIDASCWITETIRVIQHQRIHVATFATSEGTADIGGSRPLWNFAGEAPAQNEKMHGWCFQHLSLPQKKYVHRRCFEVGEQEPTTAVERGFIACRNLQKWNISNNYLELWLMGFINHFNNWGGHHIPDTTRNPLMKVSSNWAVDQFQAERMYAATLQQHISGKKYSNVKKSETKPFWMLPTSNHIICGEVILRSL